MDATRAFYQVAYRVGFHPWEDLANHAPFADSLSRLLDREEDEREPPYGPALDLGCGSGVWGVHLAKRGWQVTSIDMVSKAIQRTRKRVAEAGVDVRIVQGDVTKLRAALRAAGVDHDFRLVLDTGTFHGLTDAQRVAMGRQISVIATDDATVLLDVFAPGRRGPLPRGATRHDIESAFPGWKVTDVAAADTEPDALARRLTFDEHWYRLRRE